MSQGEPRCAATAGIAIDGWFDSHCHVPYEGGERFDVPVDAIDEALAEGVGGMVSIGTDRAQSKLALRTAATHDRVWCSVGLHPHDAIDGVNSIRDLFGDVAANRTNKVVAVGECGLDYYYDHSPRHVQMSAFAEQVVLARELDLALVIHTRDAWDDTFDVLAAEGVPERTIFHCFSGGKEEARRALNDGAYLSFSGIVTFKKAEEVREAVRLCPDDRLLVETDAPYLAPVPKRGKPNRPAYVRYVGESVAATRGENSFEVMQSTTANAQRVFRL